MATYLFKGGQLVDPQVSLNQTADILVVNGVISQIAESIDCDADQVFDCAGRVIVPGLVDMHVHLREPGYEEKGNIATETRAAVKGGFAGVCAMPNTKPVCDNATVIEFVKAQARNTGSCKVYPSGACTQGLKGEVLSEMGDMVAHGAVAFTDDGRGVQDCAMMRRVMDYAVQFGKTVMSHCQDESLVGEGQVNEGVASTRLGMFGWPAEGEEIQIMRDIALSRLTGCPLHIQHLTTARALDLVRQAKAEGLPVTCEVTPHHLFLTEDDIDNSYNTSLKMNPPLRTAEDAAALQEGLLDGSVDAIVTDHAPHTPYEKDREFELAPFGMIGLETSLANIITHMVKTGRMDWSQLVTLMSVNPRSILGVDAAVLAEGCTAELTVIDPNVEWVVNADTFESKATNSGFIGAQLTGQATEVFVDGEAKMIGGVVL